MANKSLTNEAKRLISRSFPTIIERNRPSSDMPTVNLTNCDHEPIHIPGKTQAHGFMIATDRHAIITHCSENIEAFLKVDARSLPGQHSRVLDGKIAQPDNTGFLHQIISIATASGQFQPSNPYAITLDQIPWYIVVSVSGERFIFDFEPVASNLSGDLQPQIGRALSEMLADKQLDRLLQNIAVQVRHIISYDRVMIYKFHADEHGEVVAEARKEDLEPWLGLHYPATDIPRQARELYKLNLIRLIADVHSAPSALLTHEAAPLDLTCSSLRAVSPIHIQYLKNMQVASSFSVSILDNDRLWGLIACHNYTPRYINYRQRESARLIGQVLSSAISFRQAEMDQHLSMRLKERINEVTHQLLREIPVPEALLEHPTTLQAATFAEGAALFFENELYLTGQTPDRSAVLGLIDWLSENQAETTFVTEHLAGQFPPALAFKAVASGLLACRLSNEVNEFLLWFKPEVINTVKWAGNPEKPMEVREGVMTISPRQSFAAWSQLVMHHSLPWLNAEVEAARAVREEVNHAINRKVTAFRILNGKLKEAYAELDAFSYTLSHDLKNPVAAIRGFAQLIANLTGDNEAVREMAERINLRSKDLIRMIEEVLHYSRMGKRPTERKMVNMQKLLTEIRRDLLVAYNHPHLEISIDGTPDIVGDETMLFQVFSNLLSNAVKYSSKEGQPKVTITGQSSQSGITYAITDNGIGIDSIDHEKIFGLFSRADNSGAFEGSGVGLAIVKRIVARHQGKIWLESEPNAGSTFYVQFVK